MFSFRGHVAYKNVRRSFERSMEGPGCCYESLLPPPTPHPSPPLPIRPTDSHVLSLSPLPPLVVASQTIAKRSREATGAAPAMEGERGSEYLAQSVSRSNVRKQAPPCHFPVPPVVRVYQI